MFTVYGMSDSGNCYKVRLALEQLSIPCRWLEIDTAKGETRTPEFLARNPNGQVPALVLEDGSCLPESGAILNYLADIALYAYTHCAADGGFDLSAYPAIRRWLDEVERQPRHVPMPA